MTTTEILQLLIYPAIYEEVETILPEFRFKKLGSDGAQGYRSTNGLKIDGTNGDAVGRIRIYPNNISHLIDHRGGFISIWDYIQRREGLSDRETLLHLAQLAKIKLPEKELTAEQLEKVQHYRRRAEIWEALNTYLKRCFYDESNQIAHSQEAREVREYLFKTRADGGRGYTAQDIEIRESDGERLQLIEVGVLTDPNEAYKHLRTLGYEDQELRAVLQLTEDGRIGRDGYYLTLPYRDGSGAIRGLIIRNIRYNPTNKKNPKYLFTKSLDSIKGKILYNLRPLTGTRELLIVESQLDAQLAAVRGLVNVVAIGGKHLTADQVRQALKMRPKLQSFTLLLDNEAETVPQIKAAIDTILKEAPTASVYVAQIGEPGVKDLEEYLIAYGVDAFKANVLANKVPYWLYLLNDTINHYVANQEDDGLTPAQEDQLLREVVSQANKITLPTDRQRYINTFSEGLNNQGYGWHITPEVLQATADKIKYSQDQEEQQAEFKKLLAKAQDLQAKGEIGQALQLLTERSRAIKEKDKTTEFNGLLLPTNEDQVRERLANKPESLRTGYTIQKEELLLPTGAVSIVAAPTSHGKTTFLINLALNTAKQYQDKQFYVFSYEEDADSILVSSLNAYIGEELSVRSRDSIKSYFRDGSTEYISQDKRGAFLRGKERFFKELINTQRYSVHYVDYSSDTLIDAIYYLHKNTNVGGVFIDYMQLLHKGQRGNNKYGSRQEELKQICIDLKDLAVATGLPIVLGAQFNREVTNQLRLHPTKIGEAGDIERVANLIVGFWNNDFEPLTEKNGDLNDIERLGANTPGTLYTKILKNRGGRVGLTEVLSYNGNAGTISNGVHSAAYNDPFK